MSRLPHSTVFQLRQPPSLAIISLPSRPAITPGVRMNVSICIATYRRPQRLGALLADLALQQRLPQEVIVVDNDEHGSAGSIVDLARVHAPFPLHYEIQPQKNLSLTRNRSVALASGDWLAFIDDDERAAPTWLGSLIDLATRLDADGVLGPVEPLLPAEAPAWLRRGRFYDWPRMPSGTPVPLNRLRFGNVMLRHSTLQWQQPVFDPAYGLTGGEDGDLLTRLTQAGARLFWCDEAVVTEPVEPARLSLRWLLLRALRGGQDFARHTLAGRYGGSLRLRRIGLFLRALVQMLVASLLALLYLPLGRHHAARWLTKAAANLGKLSVFFGMHYREYA
jgi:succinoglycan biosynthesis protein ExoM